MEIKMVLIQILRKHMFMRMPDTQVSFTLSWVCTYVPFVPFISKVRGNVYFGCICKSKCHDIIQQEVTSLK